MILLRRGCGTPWEAKQTALQLLATLFCTEELLDCDWRQEGAMAVMLCHPRAYSLTFWSNEYLISWYKVKELQIEPAAENRCVLHSFIYLPSAETQNPLFVIVLLSDVKRKPKTPNHFYWCFRRNIPH